MEIKTAEDWWSLLDQNWSKILECFENCNAPLHSECWRDEIGGDEIFHEKTLLITLEEAKQKRDHEAMHHLLQLCWMAAPDAEYIHQWPGWGALCDLCSENWVFYSDEAVI